MMDLHQIANSFRICGEISSIEAVNQGHINTTYRIRTSNSGYILQKINHDLFQDVNALNQNIIRITNHISSKYATRSKAKQTLELVLSKDSEGFFVDVNGNYWRMFKEIEETTTFESIATEEQARSMGEAFGEFHSLLIDLPNPPLQKTLPHFHNIEVCLDRFKKAIAKDEEDRVAIAVKEINYLLELEEEIREDLSFLSKRKIPKRNVHQDTKLSNVLFNFNGEVVAVIDLDTTTQGYLYYDFGDAVRGGMNNAKEDERHLDRVFIQMPFFRSFTRGYIHATKNFILPEEIDTLALGVKLITYEQAIRFLEDFLHGDIYYQIQHKDHNLTRTRVQITLLQDVLKRYSQMESYIKEVYLKETIDL